MSELLFFLVFPITVIIFSIALEKVLNSPILVAGIIFSIFLILTFTVFDTSFIVYTVAYTVISYLTAIIYRKLADNCDRINFNDIIDENHKYSIEKNCYRNRYSNR